jgi:hypothetical protein
MGYSVEFVLHDCMHELLGNLLINQKSRAGLPILLNIQTN